GLLGRFQSSSFTPDINGIILAAHRDNYVILKLLLDRGDRIYKPHDLRCACNICTQARRENGLQHSTLRINTYRALTSPSFIILTSSDPILTAFELSWELKKLGELENEFRLFFCQPDAGIYLQFLMFSVIFQLHNINHFFCNPIYEHHNTATFPI
ncbi:unnamed protein product, partial [Schistosoma curassoni]|uniref:TRP_2 domain-containing protein n=1 Tax=Schistosoma curassoni TaxID=6186 RepID=A0A183KW63_9TREM